MIPEAPTEDEVKSLLECLMCIPVEPEVIQDQSGMRMAMIVFQPQIVWVDKAYVTFVKSLVKMDIGLSSVDDYINENGWDWEKEVTRRARTYGY